MPKNRTTTILLLNPPVYDFTAYDFWLKPYGLLSIAGFLRERAKFKLFDYTDRQHEFYKQQKHLKSDKWDRGQYYQEKIEKPKPLAKIPRYFRRFGLPGKIFQKFLDKNQPSDYVLIQTMMTYWYPGLIEVIADLRNHWPQTKIIMGGNYVTLCPNHAKTLGADLLIEGTNLNPLWQYLDIKPDPNQPALWESYKKLNVGTLKLTQGCPFKCTYCSVPKVYKKFTPRDINRSLAELELLIDQGAKNIAFYDDALLYNADQILIPFLKQVLTRKIKTNFHTPNALNARFLTPQLAEIMVTSGFKTFYIGFESISEKWQAQSGSKVFSKELSEAVKNLTQAGADPKNIIAYQILGHPNSDIQQLEDSIKFVNSLGICGMLADFSPIPKTKDGQKCEKWIDMNEPLMHNKTAFPIILLGPEKVNHLKQLQKELNSKITN